MKNLKSSFWGGVSYIGILERDPTKVLLRIAGHDIVVRKSDQGLKSLRVTSGGNKTLVILTPSTTDSSVLKIRGILVRPTVRQVLFLQAHLCEDTLTDELFAKENPLYHLRTPKKKG